MNFYDSWNHFLIHYMGINVNIYNKYGTMPSFNYIGINVNVYYIWVNVVIYNIGDQCHHLLYTINVTIYDIYYTGVNVNIYNEGINVIINYMESMSSFYYTGT